MTAVVDPGTGAIYPDGPPAGIYIGPFLILDPAIPSEPPIPGAPTGPNPGLIIGLTQVGIPASSGNNNARYYALGWCTWYVAILCPWIPGGLGNADTWPARARAKGFSVVPYPVVGSVVCYGPGHGYSDLGHVAVVDAVFGPNAKYPFRVTEMAYVGWGKNDSRLSTMTGVVGFILPPGSPVFTGPPPLPIPSPVTYDLDGLRGAWARLIAWLGSELPRTTDQIESAISQLRGH